MSNSSERSKPLGFDLRTRIASAVARELVHQARERGEYQKRDCYKVADAVIRELRLKLQREEDGDEEPKGLFTQHRYVTDWKTDE